MESPPSTSIINLTTVYSTVESVVEQIKSENDFHLLQINDCPSMQEGIDLILNDAFKEEFIQCPSAIGVSIKFNEKFKVLDFSQLDDMENKYSDIERSILISFQSTVDEKFFIRWRLKDKIKMLTLEVEESHGEDLKEVEGFLTNFLMKSLVNGETGELFIVIITGKPVTH